MQLSRERASLWLRMPDKRVHDHVENPPRVDEHREHRQMPLGKRINFATWSHSDGCNVLWTKLDSDVEEEFVLQEPVVNHHWWHRLVRDHVSLVDDLLGHFHQSSNHFDMRAICIHCTLHNVKQVFCAGVHEWWHRAKSVGCRCSWYQLRAFIRVCQQCSS